MADLEQLKKLNELDEKGLREDVLLPLLTRLGCKPPTIYHGPQERGKDIITYTHDLLGQREYLAVVAKAVDLSGSVSSSKGLSAGGQGQMRRGLMAVRDARAIRTASRTMGQFGGLAYLER